MIRKKYAKNTSKNTLFSLVYQGVSRNYAILRKISLRIKITPYPQIRSDAVIIRVSIHNYYMYMLNKLRFVRSYIYLVRLR